MTESTEVKTREQPAIASGASRTALAPLSPASVARRHRFVRVLFVVMTLGGLGLSAVPRGTYGTGRPATTVTTGGATAEVQEFSFRRDYGVPFRTVSTTLGDAGQLKSVIIDGEGSIGVLGNMIVAAALVIGFSLIPRRRKPPE